MSKPKLSGNRYLGNGRKWAMGGHETSWQEEKSYFMLALQYITHFCGVPIHNL
jgi:hypothetical protein